MELRVSFLKELQGGITELSIEKGGKRRGRRYPRAALRYFAEYPFKHLLYSGNDQALLNATEVDNEVYDTDGEMAPIWQEVFTLCPPPVQTNHSLG